MRLVSLMCPQCGAQLQIDVDRSQAFCQYCGAKLLLDDESTTININQRIIDEARLKEAEVRLKELEYQHEISHAYTKEKRSWRTMLLVYVALLAVGFLLGSTRMFGYVLLFGGIALMVLKPKAGMRWNGRRSDLQRAGE